MGARTILSENLRRLMAHAKETQPPQLHLSAIRKVAAASNGRLTNGTVGRIAKGSHTTDIDTLADLAQVFGLQPWQLLVEDLNPKALPRLADAALLSQIKQIVDSVPAAAREESASLTDEQPLQTAERNRQSKVGPDLKAALAAGGGKNAGRGTQKVSKQKARGRR